MRRGLPDLIITRKPFAAQIKFVAVAITPEKSRNKVFVYTETPGVYTKAESVYTRQNARHSQETRCLYKRKKCIYTTGKVYTQTAVSIQKTSVSTKKGWRTPCLRTLLPPAPPFHDNPLGRPLGPDEGRTGAALSSGNSQVAKPDQRQQPGTQHARPKTCPRQRTSKGFSGPLFFLTRD